MTDLPAPPPERPLRAEIGAGDEADLEALDAAIDAEADRRQGIAGRVAGGRPVRPVQVLATVGLIGITGGAVGGLVYDVVLGATDSAATSANTLGLIATGGLGALVAIGGVNRDKGEPPT